MRTLGIAAALGLVVGLFVMAPLAAQAQSPAPATVARNCYLCHGPEAQSPGPMPTLRGQPAEALAKALLEFKADQRKGTIMNRIAKGYSDDDLRAVATYIAGLK